MLENAAAYYEDEAQTTVGTLTALMEPALVLLLGGVTLMVVLGVFLPLLSVMSAVG